MKVIWLAIRPGVGVIVVLAAFAVFPFGLGALVLWATTPFLPPNVVDALTLLAGCLGLAVGIYVVGKLFGRWSQ